MSTDTQVIPEPGAAAPAPTSSGGKGRGIGAWICFVLAALLTLLAVVSYWGQRTINDPARYAQTVSPLVDDPTVQAAISAKVTEAIQSQVDVEATLNEVFSGVITDRPKLQLLIGPLAGAINGFIAREVDAVVKSDKFADLWTNANEKAQQAMLAVLRGDDSGAVSVQGDQVVLNLDDVIAAVKQRLVDRGLTIIQNVPIPQTDRQIVLMTSPQLKQARTIYAFTNPVATWLIWFVAALYLAAFLLARRRPVMTVAIGLAVLINALLLGLAMSIGSQLFTNELAGTVWGPASAAFWDTLMAFLIRSWHTFAWLGVVLIAAGWFAGRNKSGTATRGFLGAALENLGAALPAAARPAGRWVAGNAGWLRWVAVAIGWLVLLWGSDTSPEELLWAVILVIVLLAVLQVLVGAGKAPAGDADGASAAADAGSADAEDSAAATAAVAGAARAEAASAAGDGGPTTT